MATPLIKQVCQLVGQKRKVKVIARREIMHALKKKNHEISLDV